MKFFSSRQVAVMLGLPEGTLRSWRATGVGPNWYKLEGSIRYSETDVRKYLDSNRRISTAHAFAQEKANGGI
jgi:hypothetical protein